MKRFFRSLLILIIPIFVLYSCSDSEYSLDNFWLSLGFIDLQTESADSYQIITDGGDTLVPVANAVPYFNIYQDQRVLVNYTVLDDADEEKSVRLVRVNNLQEILYKDLLQLTITNADSIGNDPIDIVDVWTKNDVLNIEFDYYGSGYIVHYINLVYEEQLDQQELPIMLEFKHNARGDNADRLLHGIVSFDLKKLKVNDEGSVNYVVRALDYDNQFKTFDGVYTY